MFIRSLVAAFAALVLFGSQSLASSVTTAEAISVGIRANVRVHYLTPDEQSQYAPSGNANLPTVFSNEMRHEDAPPPDEFYSDTLICSGFIVKDDGQVTTVITARHCTQPNIERFLGLAISRVDIVPTSVEFIDGSQAPVVNVKKSETADLSILSVVEKKKPVLATLRATPLRRGEPLSLLGMPGGHEFFYSSGMSSAGPTETTADAEGPDFAGLIPIECVSCYGGDSGAAVLDANGDVVGLLDADMGEPGLNAIVPAYRIIAALNAP